MSPVRTLVVGDSFLPTPVFQRGFARLEDRLDFQYLQVDPSRVLDPHTASEQRIREYEGHPDEIRDCVHDADVLVVHGAAVTDEVLAAAPHLRLIACARGGPVNVDVDAATARQIPVVTTPGKNADAVAELVIAFIVMIPRRLGYAQREAALMSGAHSTFEGARFLGHEVAGRRLGLVGYGNVARAVARRAMLIDVEVSAFDPFVDEQTTPRVRRTPSLDELLATSDIVSLHARATPENRNMIGTRELSLMPEGAVLINTARESLVDEAALDAALSSGRLAGAALDVVVPHEGGPHPLASHTDVVITPHIGGATHETLARGVAMIAEELEALVDRRPPLRLANPSLRVNRAAGAIART